MVGFLIIAIFNYSILALFGIWKLNESTIN